MVSSAQKIVAHIVAPQRRNMSNVSADRQCELLMLLFVIEILQEQADNIVRTADSLLVRHIQEQRRLNRSLPADKIRPTWEGFSSRISPDHFRRMFRMPLDGFSALCRLFTKTLGEERFRPEDFLKGNSKQLYEEGEPNLPVPGEVKVAISIRFLAGGSYLDLVPLFHISTTYLYTIFDAFLDWVMLTFEFPLVRWLRENNWGELNKRANLFAEKTDGIFYGPVGALDGLAVRVKSPTLGEVTDPGNYFCRKGFYALNVQAICDLSKRFLWCYPSNKGSTHDSAAFANSRLYDLLKEKATDLYERGLFIAGDSAYGLAPFLVTPYEQEELKNDPMHVKDSFNYHLSSCRIYIECAFGELVMRWGIFWRTLLFELKKCCKVIQVCMLLHNYIVDFRDEMDDLFFTSFAIEMDEIQQTITRTSGEMPRAVATDNNEPRRRGRPTFEESKLSELGEKVRHRLTVKLSSHDRRRPLQHDMHYNQHGHIYMTS
jgi:DDE superfamily endonuclease